MSQKKLWERLAKENPLYYINTDKGRGITEDEFRESGRADYHRLIINDSLIRTGSLDKDIVDLGCGVGRITEFMALDFRKVVGVDISGEMIKLAKERLKKYPNIGLFETDGETIPLFDNSIDIVFSYLVFQHIKDRAIVEKNFEEVSRVLKPAGIFKVRVRSDKVDLGKWWGGVEYTEQTIGRLIEKVGFDLIRTEPVGDYGFWLWLRK